MGIDMDKFIDGLHDYLGKAFAPVGARLAALESAQGHIGELRAEIDRLAELVSRATAEPFAEGKLYRPGERVKHLGRRWRCNFKTRTEPGDSHAWSLDDTDDEEGEGDEVTP